MDITPVLHRVNPLTPNSTIHTLIPVLHRLMTKPIGSVDLEIIYPWAQEISVVIVIPLMVDMLETRQVREIQPPICLEKVNVLGNRWNNLIRPDIGILTMLTLVNYNLHNHNKLSNWFLLTLIITLFLINILFLFSLSLQSQGAPNSSITSSVAFPEHVTPGASSSHFDQLGMRPRVDSTRPLSASLREGKETTQLGGTHHTFTHHLYLHYDRTPKLSARPG